MTLTAPKMPAAGSPINYAKQYEDYKKEVVKTGNAILEDMNIKKSPADKVEISIKQTKETAEEAAKTGFFDKIGTFVKGHKIATAVLGAIAALGVAFGVYTKVQANKVEAAREAQMEAEAQTPQAETV